MTETRSSNATSVSVAEESTYKVLPATPRWHQVQPFEMGDIGGEPVLVEPAPYREDQSMDFGRKVDVTASGSFQLYMNGLNILRTLQGFFVSDVVEQTSTYPLNSSGAAAISALTTSQITLASLGDDFAAGDIIVFGGGTGAAAVNNKRIAVVTGSPTATRVTVDGTPFVAATTGLSGAYIQKVGVEFGSGELSLTVSGTTIQLVATGSHDFTTNTHGLIVGQSIFIGGDDTVNRFTGAVYGFARVRAIEAKRLTIDNPSFAPAASAGTGKKIRLFYPTVLRNVQTEAARNKRSYVIERSLGQGETQNSSQAQYVIGAAPNAFTLSFPLAQLITANFNYMPAKPTYEASALKSGTRIPATSYTNYFNTTSDLVLARVATHDPSLVPESFFGVVSEFTLEQTNNITLNKGHGYEGGFDVTYGDFAVTASVTAFFKTVAPLAAIIENKRAQYHAYYGHDNQGFSIDIPLASLSGGIPAFSKNQAITVPLNLSGAKSDSIGAGFGHVMMYCCYPFLPTIGEGRAK